MRGNTVLPSILFGILLLITLQVWYNAALIEQLRWLLYPTGYMLSWILSSTPEFIPQKGYLFNELNIILGKTCSGFTFLLLFIGLIYFRFHNYYTSPKSKFLFTLLILIAAYPITIVMNVSRILIGILGQRIGDVFLTAQPHRVLHEWVGLFCYMAALVLIYKIVSLYHTKHFSNEKIVPS